ncbi:flagellar biosynthesis protein FlgF [Burkholderia ubonensis]|uniref:Flagellar basal-body rod protein FlgF n=1 Tax=Burkholderia ubonensis TaxID=101571 RepID=A0ABD4EB03_9BURK|nr:flagellar basal-body rod protein FlgF [Burkholderia ubonensis]KVN88055.1 flagellar biosynthesis protein FlgF [Burkholderia ubonensis]KVN93220.1 flagellar biosynthesis protein FlgF [Burkholderia ubonensis]KVO00115.1 flagellar biosynthesis protein FlgF [Burkholderia ubonensis]KVO19471.1 flagellar biosynthesis protein FlgF [Burkholderia ubonensis]KVP07068.1 flagellar biosynthesis protein FlgF [Burkholderia ubonensis]
MDRLIYTAMTGASQALDQQAIVANNLANASTTGFRAQLATYRAVPMNFGDGSTIDPTTTRTYVLSSTPGSDFAPGPISRTGNPLDVAVQGAGWLSVQLADGSEAYTRDGNLHVNQDGQLVNASNLPVVGNGGPISVPPNAEVTIGKDGTVSALMPGDPPTAVAMIDRMKLVNPDPATITRGNDGLFRTTDGNPADADPNVVVVANSLEGSNVNPVNAMVAMIDNARAFQLQSKMIQTADQNEQSANQLLNFS